MFVLIKSSLKEINTVNASKEWEAKYDDEKSTRIESLVKEAILKQNKNIGLAPHPNVSRTEKEFSTISLILRGMVRMPACVSGVPSYVEAEVVKVWKKKECKNEIISALGRKTNDYSQIYIEEILQRKQLKGQTKAFGRQKRF